MLYTVMHVIDSGGLYGAERVLLTLMREQSYLGVETLLCSIGTEKEQTKPLEMAALQLGLRMKAIRGGRGPDPRMSARVLGLARALRVHVVHTHGYRANILVAAVPRRLRKVPVLSTVHGWNEERWWRRMSMYERVERLALSQAERVVAVTGAQVRRHRLDLRYGDRVRIIHNGIPIHAEQHYEEEPALSKRIRLFIRGRFAAIAVGRLERVKAFPRLISAFARVIAAGLDACLVIAGEGRERARLETQIRELNLQEKVLLLGYCENLPAILPEFSILVISSQSEGIPICLLEAMRAGIPVVSTAVGGIPEIIENGVSGILVGTDDIQAMADGMMELARDGAQMSRLADAARSILRERFTSTSMARKYILEYKSIAV